MFLLHMEGEENKLDWSSGVQDDHDAWEKFKFQPVSSDVNQCSPANPCLQRYCRENECARKRMEFSLRDLINENRPPLSRRPGEVPMFKRGQTPASISHPHPVEPVPENIIESPRTNEDTTNLCAVAQLVKALIAVQAMRENKQREEAIRKEAEMNHHKAKLQVAGAFQQLSRLEQAKVIRVLSNHITGANSRVDLPQVMARCTPTESEDTDDSFSSESTSFSKTSNSDEDALSAAPLNRALNSYRHANPKQTLGGPLLARDIPTMNGKPVQLPKGWSLGQPAQMTGAERVHNWKYKTQICSHWLSARCPFGEKCSFAHGNKELRTESSER